MKSLSIFINFHVTVHVTITVHVTVTVQSHCVLRSRHTCNYITILYVTRCITGNKWSERFGCLYRAAMRNVRGMSVRTKDVSVTDGFGREH